LLKYYQLTGEEKYLRLLETAWEDICTHRLYITGTASDHEIFVQSGLLKATNDDKMGEGCVTVTWIQFNLSLLQITGKVKYAEEIERSVYNHLLAAENPQTGCVSYYTALQGVKPYRCDQGYSCCLSSVPRGISLIPEMIGGKIGGNFSVLLYENGVASTKLQGIEGGEVGLVVKSKTRFPADGVVEFAVEPARKVEFTINFRVPKWAENFKAVVEAGEAVADSADGSVCGSVRGEIYQGKTGEMLAIRRTWAAGDRVKVTFDMPVEVLPGGLSFPNSVAIKRGPQVLAIDKGLNAGIDSLVAVGYRNGLKLTDASTVLPANWGWKEAFFLDATVDGGPKKVVLVPFAEAGQKSGEVEVWIARRN
jgi:hypothetical protein